jgi:type VI secretion system secreted protein VgrG
MMTRPNKRMACSTSEHNSRALKLSGTKQILMGLGLAAGVMLTQPVMAAGPAPIDLKSCSHFTILATSTVTTTGGGIINGDIGLSPAGSQGIPPAQVNGTIYNGGPIAAQAQLDLNDAIIAASPAQLPGGINVGDGELGGRVLAPGVYKSAPGSYAISLVDLTLNGGPDDVWVFQMASTLTVGVGRQIILTGGAQARNIFWQVGSSATLQTSSVFKGTIMAYASITMNASSTMDGRALAQTGAVTFDGTGGSLPTPEAPIFAKISRTNISSVTVVLTNTPYFLLTLQTSPGLSLPNWTTIATNTPVTSPWTFTDTNVMATVTQRFYRAFITTP